MQTSDNPSNILTYPIPSMTISGTLMLHVRLIYLLALEKFDPRYYPHKDINFGTPHAIPAYIVAVDAVEAFLTETFFVLCRGYIKDAPLWNLTKSQLDELDNKPLMQKLKEIPTLLVNKSLPPEDQAMQEMKLLIKVRNRLVHYKMKAELPDCAKTLLDRGIGLNALNPHGYEPWTEILSTSEGIRWANNTASNIAHALHQLLPEEYQTFSHELNNFPIIDKQLARLNLTLKGIDSN